MNSPVLEAQNITKRFGGLVAVDNLSFGINQGEIVGLIGPNGAGKTTVFNMLTGFYSPTAGRISYKGKDITGSKPHTLAKKGLTRTFQLTTLFGNLSVLQNVVVSHHLHTDVGFVESVLSTPSAHQKQRELEQKALEILELGGISDLKNKLAKELPHGHQRVLEVAIALATEPEMLLLDEPVTGMNWDETLAMMSLIKKLKEQGITILLVEHNMQTVMGVCDRIIVVNFGKKIAEGSPSEIRQNEAVIEAYLGVEEHAS